MLFSSKKMLVLCSNFLFSQEQGIRWQPSELKWKKLRELARKSKELPVIFKTTRNLARSDRPQGWQWRRACPGHLDSCALHLKLS
jgi:hypothetical protein